MRVQRRLAAELQHFQESTAGFSSLRQNLRGGACHARWRWCSLDVHITAVQLYVPVLDAARRPISGCKKQQLREGKRQRVQTSEEK